MSKLEKKKKHLLQVKSFNEKAFRKDKYKNWVLFTSTNSAGMNIFFFSVNWLRKEYAASSYILKPNFKIP